MIRFNEDDPKDCQYIMQLRDNLDIGDASIHMLRNSEQNYKEIIVCYKTIYINTYNINVIDLSNIKSTTQMPHINFRHRSFQLWESGITGLLLQKKNDLVTVSRDGISVSSLGSMHNRILTASDKEQIKQHSFESFSYLKIDPIENCLLYDFIHEKNKLITVQ